MYDERYFSATLCQVLWVGELSKQSSVYKYFLSVFSISSLPKAYKCHRHFLCVFCLSLCTLDTLLEQILVMTDMFVSTFLCSPLDMTYTLYTFTTPLLVNANI